MNVSPYKNNYKPVSIKSILKIMRKAYPDFKVKTINTDLPSFNHFTKEDYIISQGWVRWHKETWRHKDYSDKLEGFTTDEVLNILNKKHNEIKDIDIANMYPYCL